MNCRKSGCQLQGSGIRWSGIRTSESPNPNRQLLNSTRLSAEQGGKMANLTLKCSADGTHEAYDGDRKVGEIENDHLYDYAAKHAGQGGGSVQGNLSARGAGIRLSGCLCDVRQGSRRGRPEQRRNPRLGDAGAPSRSRPRSLCCRKPSARTASSTTAGWMRWTIPARSAAPPGAAPRTPNSACRTPSTAAKSLPP